MVASQSMDSTVEKIASLLYGVKPILHPLHSYGSFVYRLEFGEPIGDKAFKLAKKNKEYKVFREQQIILSLYEMGLEVPKIEFTQADGDFGDAVFTITAWITGRTLEEIYAKSPELSKKAFKRIGDFVARLGTVPLGKVSGALELNEARAREEERWTEAYTLLNKNQLLSPRLNGLMKSAKKLLDKDYSCFIHRDGPQIITDGRTVFAAIDWDSGGPGHPLRDLGILIGCYSAWLTGDIRNSNWFDWLMKGYLRNGTMNEALAGDLYILTMYYLIEIAMFHGNLYEWVKANEILSIVEVNDKESFCRRIKSL